MLGRKKITYYRHEDGHYNEDGLWVDGEIKEHTILASVQPAKIYDRTQYSRPQPEGEVQFNYIRLYSDEPLRVAQESTHKVADIVLWRGLQYIVVQVEDFQSNIINHFKIKCVECDPDNYVCLPEEGGEDGGETPEDRPAGGDADPSGVDAGKSL